MGTPSYVPVGSWRDGDFIHQHEDILVANFETTVVCI